MSRPPAGLEEGVDASVKAALDLITTFSQGKMDPEMLAMYSPGVASRWPWLVAFIFGLLHGFGFSGALAEVGLPQNAIPLALIFFNVGVEIGQLFFVSTVLIIAWLLHRLKQPVLLARGEIVAVYVIGSFSSFWLFGRISLF